MARKQLINLHSLTVKNPSTSEIQPSITVGEIVVQAVKSAATIYTKVFDATSGTTADTAAYTFAEFIDKTQVQALISASTSAVADRVEDLEEAVTAISGTVTSVQATANTALQTVSATGANAYVSAVAGNKTGNDGAKTQKITVTANVAGDLSGVGSGDTKLADAYKVKQYVDAETSARQGKDTELENAITGLSADFNNAVSGIGKEQGSIKSYVDSEISTAIASVYRVKGSVDNYSDLALISEKKTGDVYNVINAATVDEKWYPAGTNWVWNGSAWDALGGTIDLSVYAYNSALTTEQQARTDGDKAINDKIGGSYTSANTVHSAIVAAKTGADNSLKTVSASGTNDYVSASAGSVSGEAGAKTQTITVTANVSSNINAETERGKLADAYEVRTLVSGATASTQGVSDRVKVLEDEMGNGVFSSSNTVTDVVTGITATMLTQVNVSGDDYLTASTSRTGSVESVTLTSDVVKDISNISATGHLADAYAIKTYVDTEIAEATASTKSVSDRVGVLEGKIGTNSSFDTEHTISDAVASLESNALQSVTIKNTSTNNIKATKSGTSVQLDFDDMVINCGEY